MTIIPAIDLIEGKVVRLSQGNYYKKTIYSEDPVTVAKKFEDAGLTHLHLVDLDGARAGRVEQWKILEKIAATTGLKIDFSGGVSTIDQARRVLDSGATLISVGSIAVNNPLLFETWLDELGSDQFIIGADTIHGKIAVRGWTEVTVYSIQELIGKYWSKGVNRFFCTDISKDGLLQGPAFELYQELLSNNEGIEMIASGGITTLNDLSRLKELGCKGAILGKALLEEKITLKDLQKFMAC